MKRLLLILGGLLLALAAAVAVAGVNAEPSPFAPDLGDLASEMRP